MAKVREQDWLDATEYSQLDVYRAAKDQHRKWRLFAAGCCRHAILLAPDPQMDQLVEGAEQFADGVISWDEMKKVRRLLTAIGKGLDPNGDGIFVWSLRDCLVDVAAKVPLTTLQVGHNARYAFGHARSNPDDQGEAYEVGVAEGERVIVALARCVFGNPFRPVAFDPSGGRALSKPLPPACTPTGRSTGCRCWPTLWRTPAATPPTCWPTFAA